MTTSSERRAEGKGLPSLGILCIAAALIFLIQIPALSFREALPLYSFPVLFFLFLFLFRFKPFSSWAERIPASIPAIFFIALLLLVAGVYLWNYWGEILFFDDHSSFLQREKILSETFPRLVNYDPFFNGGHASEGILISGAVNLFLAFAPFRAWLSLEQAYSLQPLLLILLAPLSLYAAARLLGRSRGEGLTAAFLSLAATFPGGYFSFPSLLKFGMLPYVFSTLLSLPIFALFWRFFILRKGGIVAFSFLVLLTFFAFFHLSLIFTLAPLLFTIPWIVRGQAARKRLPWLLLYGLTLLIHLVWFIPFWTLYHDHPASAQLRTERRAEAPAEAWTEGKEEESPSILEKIPWGLKSRLAVNPLLYLGLLGALGFLLKEDSRVRGKGLLYISFYAYFLLLIGPGMFFAEFLEPGRYLFPLSLFLIIPASTILAPRLSSQFKEGNAAGRALAASLFVAGAVLIFNVSLSIPKIHSRTPALAAWLKENTDPGARIYFEDFHEALSGHLAYLQVMADRHFVGEPYESKHRRVLNWNRLTDFAPEDLSRFFNLYNILYVVVRSPREIKLLQEAPGVKRIKAFGDLAIFKTGISPSFFLRGKGKLKKAAYNRIEFRLDEAGGGVLKLKWVPGLKGSPGLTIKPYPTFTGEQFIEVESGKEGNFLITFDRWWLI